MPTFLNKHLRFEERRYSEDALRLLWADLGVDPRVADTLAVLGLLWQDVFLLIDRAQSGVRTMMEDVDYCLTHVF